MMRRELDKEVGGKGGCSGGPGQATHQISISSNAQNLDNRRW